MHIIFKVSCGFLLVEIVLISCLLQLRVDGSTLLDGSVGFVLFLLIPFGVDLINLIVLQSKLGRRLAWWHILSVTFVLALTPFLLAMGFYLQTHSYATDAFLIRLQNTCWLFCVVFIAESIIAAIVFANSEKINMPNQ